MDKIKVGVIGGGNMGAAVIAGVSQHYTVSVCEQDTRRANVLKNKYKIQTLGLEALVGKSDVLILAVKPQQFDSVLKDIQKHANVKQIIVSIAAGITTKYIESKLGDGFKVIRSMPNLPAQIGEGITGISKGKNATQKDLKTISTILDCIGQTVIVDENSLDALTAVSGSGPAYVFLFAECFLQAAKSVGLK
jgi:pyrroline-5-carboxylate reductase